MPQLQGRKDKGVRLTGKGSYPLIPLSLINLVDRPLPGEESTKLFYNPRSLDSFTAEEMASLRTSIQNDGLLEPIIVRVFTSDEKLSEPVERVELVAGERRFRCLCSLVEENALCYDSDSSGMKTAQELYSKVACRAFYNISDEQSLRIAFEENNEHKPLSIMEEVNLVERLTSVGMRQDQICALLGANITWVSQTGNFRTELPGGAFEKLINGQLSRHVAVQILSFRSEDRERLYLKAEEVEIQQSQKEILSLKSKVEDLEDEEDLEHSQAVEALREGDNLAHKRHAKKAAAAQRRTEVIKQKKLRAESEKGKIRQGHLSTAAQTEQVSPKKAKILTKGMIEQFYRDLLGVWLKNGKIDPICKESLPEREILAMRATALAILSGQYDPCAVVRQLMVSRGEWTLPDDYEEQPVEHLEIEAGDEELAD